MAFRKIKCINLHFLISEVLWGDLGDTPFSFCHFLFLDTVYIHHLLLLHLPLKGAGVCLISSHMTQSLLYLYFIGKVLGLWCGHSDNLGSSLNIKFEWYMSLMLHIVCVILSPLTHVTAHSWIPANTCWGHSIWPDY